MVFVWGPFEVSLFVHDELTSRTVHAQGARVDGARMYWAACIWQCRWAKRAMQHGADLGVPGLLTEGPRVVRSGPPIAATMDGP
jgi:hypothetical protein